MLIRLWPSTCYIAQVRLAANLSEPSKPPITFKLKKSGLTKIAKFDAQPNRLELALEISSLFDIPPLAVGVIFLDDAGEVVTLTNEKDIQNLFNKVSSADIKFVVQNLIFPDRELQLNPSP